MQTRECPVRISTITANGDLGSKVDLDIFFRELEIVPLGQQGIVWAKYRSEVRGNHPNSKRNSAESANKHFNHQVTIVYWWGPTYTPNLKVFYTGNVQMTGVKGFDDGPMFVNKIADEMHRIYRSGFESTVQLAGRDFLIRMINSDFKVPYEIRRKELYNILLDHYDITCTYQPESYPGVKINYFWNSNKTGLCQCNKFCIGKGMGQGDGDCKKVTISLFRSGSILITGATSYEQVCDAYDFIQEILQTFENQIRWTAPVSSPIGGYLTAGTTGTTVTTVTTETPKAPLRTIVSIQESDV